MEIILISILILVIVILFFKIKFGNDHVSQNISLSERCKNLSDNLQEQSNRIKLLGEANEKLSIFKGRFEQSEKEIFDLKNQIQKDKEEIYALNVQINEFEKKNELLKHQQDNLQKEKEQWSLDKEAILNKLSEELIRKNNEEQIKVSKNQQENIKKTTEDLFKNFESVLNKVSSLGDDVKKSTEDISLTKNALLNPGGAGRVSEITLENILKASGLREKITMNDPGDFIIQSHFSGVDKGGKRPDVLVFLPNNHILIIDSKSSSHFLDLQNAINQEDEALQKDLSNKIKDSMKKHLQDLKKKDYAKVKLEQLDLQDILKSKELPNITMVMFLQTERMLEIVRQIDGNFEQKALQENIQILSPVGLINLLSQAKFLIDRFKQEKNIEKLRLEIKKLADSISTMFLRSDDMGKSISRTLKTYNDFVGTFNRRFLPRINNMSKLGIEFDKKNILNKLKKIESDGGLIEIEAFEEENFRKLDS